MKLSQNSKTFLRYLAGPFLFILLGVVIWRELTAKNQLTLLIHQLSGPFLFEHLSELLLLVGLMPLNWLLEAIKWRVALRTVHAVSLITAFRATLSGVSFSILLPNRIGEYVGRILYLPADKRANAVAVTIVSSMSQLIWTLVVGLGGFVLLATPLQAASQLNASLFISFGIGVLVLLMLLLLFFFRISRITTYVAKLFSSTRIQQWLLGPSQFERKTLLTLLGLSLLRYIVFLLQYGIALHLFDVLLNPIQIISAVSVCFLVLAVVPTFAIAELGMRGLIGIWVIGIYSSNTAGILLAAFSLWVVNLILPAAMGALLLLGVQKFWRNE